jgi:hypothetical protein
MLGTAYAGVLYYKETRNDFPPEVKWVMAAIRAVAVTVISFLILNPMIKSTTRSSEKPVIIFAQDNSLSIASGGDSVLFRQQYPERLNAMLEQISASFDVEKFSFGEQFYKDLKLDFTDRLTDISEVMRNVKDSYSGRNVGALIVATDGIYNKGINPLYSTDGLNFPVYAIALGYTNSRPDLILFKVNFNRIAYLNNEFPVEIFVKADKLGGFRSQLEVLKKDSSLFKRMINITSGNFFEKISFHIKATEPGLQRYSLRLRGVDNEITQANNNLDIFIDVVEDRQKILILSQAPHPDISALMQTLTTNKNYIVDEYLVDEFDKSVSGYNLLILHCLPSAANPIGKILEMIDREHIPALYIIGRQSDYSIMNKPKTGISVRNEQVIFNEATPEYNNDFTLFNLSKSTRHELSGFPPLVSPFGNSILQPSVNVLLYQKIGEVVTGEPQLAFNDDQDSKSGVIFGTGLWKWRLANFMKKENHNAFDEVVNKTIQYLSVKLDKSLFRIYSKNNFTENENIEFTAEVYNANYEPVFGPTVSIEITDSQKKRYSFSFINRDSAYYLDAGKLPVDQYTYSARVEVGNKIYNDSGEFTVSPLNIEKISTIADHNLLYNLAMKTGGKLFYPDQMIELTDEITGSDQIRTISYTNKRFSEILNLPVLLVFLLLLIGSEWFIRKRFGSY